MRLRASRLRVSFLLSCLLACPVQAAEPALTEFPILVHGKPCSALLLRPADARALLVLAHGQIMNIRHPFMESISSALARHGIATLRFNFVYAEAKRKDLDPRPLLIEAVEAATREGERRRGSLPLLLGGKSVGGMMAAEALRDAALPGVKGLVLLSYPLHAPGRPSGVHARALEGVKQPILFLQGTRDPLADLTLMEGLVAKLGPRAKLEVVEDADHSFTLPEGSAREQEEVYDELASDIASFAATLAPQQGG
jgi:predicted alpha/beta-hydrolase family hydrolase